MLELQIFSCFFLDFFVFKNYNFAMIKNRQTNGNCRVAVRHIVIDIFDLLSHFKNICIFESTFYTKITLKSISTSTALISFNKITALKCDRFVNAGEPAAVVGFPVRLKVVERIQPESTAVGLLGGWGG
jgi:hypothetical protein